MLGLNNPKKKLCPKLEKNVNMKPKTTTFLFIEILNIYDLFYFHYLTSMKYLKLKYRSLN